MSSKHRIWTVPRVLVSFVMFALLAVSVGALSSCSDEEEKKPTGSKRRKTTSSKTDSGSSALTSLKKEVGKLVKQAKSLDVESYDGKSYASARKYFAKAKDLESDDDTPGAIRAYKQAQRQLKKGISNAEKISASLGKLDDLFEEVEELKAKGEEDGVDKNAPSLFGDASKLLARAQSAVEKPSARAASSAEQYLTAAKDAFEQATELAAQNKSFRERAEKEKVRVGEFRAMALEKGADTQALQLWFDAEQRLSSADALLESGQFGEALRELTSAGQGYTRAIEEVEAKAQLDKTLASQDAQNEAYRAHQQKLERERMDRMAQIQRDKDKRRAELLRSRGRGSSFGGGSTYLPPKPTLPDGLVAEDYIQELSEEDEEFLEENINVLAEHLTYDRDSGMVALDYTRNDWLREDLQRHPKIWRKIRAMEQRNFLKFRNVYVGNEDGSSDPTDPTLQGMDQGPTKFTFEFNTQGIFYIPVPFRHVCKATFAIQILTMDGNGSFNLMMMFDPKGKDGYISDFIHLGVLQNGNRKWVRRLGGKYGASANEWFYKTREVWMEYIYQQPHPDQTEKGPLKSGLLQVTYDMQVEPEVNRVSNHLYQRGFVGFEWHRVKAEIRKLRISGLLDKKEALSMIKKLKKVKKRR